MEKQKIAWEDFEKVEMRAGTPVLHLMFLSRDFTERTGRLY
jgi:hypothetical protein